MIALDFSGTTTQSASHNVALNQVINQSVNQAQDVCINSSNMPTEFMAGKIQSCSRFKPLRAAQFVPQSSEFYLTDSIQGTEELTANATSFLMVRNSWQKLQGTEICARRTNGLHGTKMQQLCSSSPMLIQVGIRLLRPRIVVIALGIKHVAYTHDIPFPAAIALFVVASLFFYQDARASDDSALSFPLCAEWLATIVHRLGVDASGKGGRVGMPPRRRGRGRGQFEESAGQNEDRRSARSRTHVSDEEEEVGDLPPPVERMDVVIARFQRMNPPVFNVMSPVRMRTRGSVTSLVFLIGCSMMMIFD
ncbi:hypothetical protein F511_19463 [Dorcoceras hygrometricum]|uniref:Uncharacterized protein n=1 Tax=Dorcoceras hygrometricum TaxID=472368 RepID=A0A2Z7A604_9LAMI|nr:hypothetical protein F511_19463 [Dorcoceras hygrometricum]